ncbi:MAG TPA: hypothetical protein VK465_18765 [Fibrobacteria bacterium]|nr:hypothetical protein [Fibrobacteria bacterium]
MPGNPCPEGPGGLLRAFAGHAAVAGLEALRAAPPALSRSALGALLPAYPRLRPAHARHLAALFAASPFAEELTLQAYYRARLDLLLRNLQVHGRPVSEAFPQVEVEGKETYARALARGRPVALLGLHAGPLELLHRLPETPTGRPFALVAAPAFAPALTGWLAAGREREGKRMARTGVRGDQGLLVALRAVLEARGVLAVMVDQHPGSADAHEILTLWGRIQSPYPGRLLRLLERRGCVFVPVSVRLKDSGACFRYHGIWDGAGPERVRTFLEEAIASAPIQWNWSYPKLGVAPVT